VGGSAAHGLTPAFGIAMAKINLMELKIVVYSKSACPQCESAKMVLKSKSLAFEEIKIDGEAERMAFYEKCGPSVRQMPQVFINDQRVGGLAGLQAALAQLGR
jgi:glutaredoxin